MAFAFSIPPYPHLFSTTPNKMPILFVPNVQFLTDFVNGDLGIAKKLKSGAILKMLATVKDPTTLRIFLKNAGADIGPNPEQFFKDGKFKPPTSVSFSQNTPTSGGLEALEKTMIQGIFETQKQYVIIIKLVIEHFVEIEDIIAAILGIIMRSKKPRGNPRALGYQGQQDGGGLSAGLSVLNQLGKKKGAKNKLSDGKINADNIEIPELPTYADYDGDYVAITQSVVYSTGDFDPNIEYTYIYRDIFDEPFSIRPETIPVEADDDEGDDEGLDTSVIFAIYDDKWEPVTQDEIDKNLPWAKKRFKANGTWPQMKVNEDFDYVYTTGLPFLPDSIGLPGRPEEILGIKLNWKIKRYENDGPSIDTQDGVKYIKKGFPVIAYNTNKVNATLNLFRTYYIEYSDQKIQQSLGTSSVTVEDDDGTQVNVRDYSRKKIGDMFSDFSAGGMLASDLEGVIGNNFMTLSKDNTDGLTDKENYEKVAFPFKPYKINGLWYYPDANYDMKIVKCDSTTDITFSETVSQPELKAKILRFVDRAIDFQFSEGQKLNILVIGVGSQGPVLRLFRDQTSLSFDYYQDKFQFVEGNLELIQNVTRFTFFTPDIDPSLINQPYVYQNTLRYTFTKSPNSNDYFLKTESLVGSRWVLQNIPNAYLSVPFYGEIIVLPGIRPGEIIYKIKWRGNIELLISSKNIYVGKIVDININNFIPNGLNTVSRVVFDFQNNRIVSQTQETLPNLIRIDDLSTGTKKKRIISKTNITNEKLANAETLAKGPYGSPIVTEEPGESARQSVEQVFRFQTSADDVKTYYIIEGILKSKNKNRLRTPNEIDEANNKSGSARPGGGGGHYTFPTAIFQVIKKFIRLIIKVFAKLFPAIQQFITLIKNPIQFVTDILIAKIGDDFGAEVPRFTAFSKDFMAQLKQLKQILDKLQAVKNGPPDIKEAAFDEADEFIATTFMKEYIYLSRQGDVEFLFDGSAIIKLFGDAPILKPLPTLTFGIQTNFGSLLTKNPKPPIKLIFSLGGNKNKSTESLDQIPGYAPKKTDAGIAKSQLVDGIFDPVLSVKNNIISEAGGKRVMEEVSTLYSTGNFRADYQYKYTEVTQEVLDLVTKAAQLEGIGDRESLAEAKRLLDEALKKDPNNDFIKEKKEKLDAITKMASTHPLLDFLLNILCLPLKVVIGIIMYILNFFKRLTNPFTLPSAIIDFVSFKWLLDFFSPISPNSMFAMAGILFNLETLFLEWIPQLKMGTKFEFNLNDIIKVPWATLPTYTLPQFTDLLFGMGLSAPKKLKFPFLAMITQILCLIEAIINSFIDFIWSLIGLVDPKSGRWIVLPPPYLKFCRNTNDQLSVKDMMDIMSGKFSPPRPTPDGAPSGTASSSVRDESPTSNFVYDITTSDGRNVKELNEQQLEAWMEENKDLEFTFDF